MVVMVSRKIFKKPWTTVRWIRNGHSILKRERYINFTFIPQISEKLPYVIGKLQTMNSSTRLGYLYLKGLGVNKSIQYAKKYLVDDYYQGYFLHHGINAIIDHGRAAEFYG
ncbi:unnamed protein product [Mucor hiemalis]